jgi:3-oxoacyl-[acyl-carrier protein] reductase
MTAALEGRRALVTAGSSGIGRAVATEFRARGAEVFITGTSERTAEVATEIGAVGFATADFTVASHAGVAVRAAEAALGRVDILVANTGGPKPSPFADLCDEDWAAAYRLILGSAVALARGVLPGMVRAGWGRLVFLTSTAGVVRPLPGLHLSNVMRAGVAALAQSIASEVGPRGITTNVIAPGPTDTTRRRQIMEFQAAAAGLPLAQVEERELARVPVGRLGDADEVASLAAFLCSDDAGFITGAVHVIDGGLTLT